MPFVVSYVADELGELVIGRLQPSAWGFHLAHVVTAFAVGLL
jgi:hypothetical protein